MYLSFQITWFVWDYKLGDDSTKQREAIPNLLQELKSVLCDTITAIIVNYYAIADRSLGEADSSLSTRHGPSH